MGLTFDAVDMAQAEQRMLQALASGERCFLSTPNLNFLVACRKDPAFRNSVLSSDLSVADGMPLVWLAKLLGIPISQRVAGSDLFNRLTKSSKALRVFFFGGMEGVAEKACHRMNENILSSWCVGFDSPGFISVPEMSSEETIAKINASNANFIVVALGAKKGQAWIEHNRHRLDAPLISHLGAVVNFTAGTVVRAPKLLQRLGLEWLWRVKEEPSLWRRYLLDSFALVNLLITRVLPLALHRFMNRPKEEEIASARIETRYDPGKQVITLEGAWSTKNLARLRQCFNTAVRTQGDIHIEMDKVSHLDSAVLGMLLLLYGYQAGQGHCARIVSASRRAKRIIRYNDASYLYAY